MKKLFLAFVMALAACLPSAAQQSASPTEQSFLEFTDGLYKLGQEWAEAGFDRQADWFYGQAAAAVASWRTALVLMYDQAREMAQRKATDASIEEAKKKAADEDLSFLFGDTDYTALLNGLQNFASSAEKLAKKVEKVADKVEDKAEEIGMDVFRLKEQQWYAMRDLSLVSPFPDYFRGLVYDYKGEAAEALTYYSRATSNPYFPGAAFDFSYLAQLSLSDLVALSTRLKAYQLKYEGSMTFKRFHFEKAVPTWDADALARKAADLLSQENPDNAAAQDYLEAAVRVNPFDVKYVYFCALLYSKLGDGVATARYLNEALKMDPDNAALQNSVSKWNSNKEVKL